MSPEVRSGRVSLKELAAATGVIFSLLFVGLEIQQNTSAVRSSTLQALSDSHRELVLSSLLSEDHSALIARTLQGETSEAFHFDEFSERALATAASPEFAEFFRQWRADHANPSGVP